MAKLGSKKHPIIVRVQEAERAREIMFEAHRMQGSH